MGNFWIPQFGSSSSSSSTSRPSSPARSSISSNIDEVSPNGQILSIASNSRIFSFAELKKATREFSPDTLIEKGDLESVFLGWIDEKTFAPTEAGSGMPIAVRKTYLYDVEEWDEWESVVNVEGSLSHPNLLRLLGHCAAGRELLLVYEFMPRGSLDNRLFRRGSAFPPLSWSTRIKIAVGAARGLAFLHSRQIIYSDFKASKILLDWNFNAKIFAFGLMKNRLLGENSYVPTRVGVTYNNAASEYLPVGLQRGERDVVYSFGIVLLEMLSGLQAFDENRPIGQRNLVDWAKPYLFDRRKVLSQVMDKRLEGQYPSKGAVQVAGLILKCLGSFQRNCPSITEVVEALEQIQFIKHMPLES